MAKRIQQKRTLIARVTYAQWLAVKSWAKSDRVKVSTIMRELIGREERRRSRIGGDA